MNIDDLKKPFHKQEIEWRVQSSGVAHNGPWAIVLAYVTNRAIMARLDEVCGQFNWQNNFIFHESGAILCSISIKGENGEWVTKLDGAEETKVEAFKGGLSASMKRAAVQWGIGRYLYRLETRFAVCMPERPQDLTGWHQGYDKKTQSTFWWQEPELPDWALPKK